MRRKTWSCKEEEEEDTGNRGGGSNATTRMNVERCSRLVKEVSFGAGARDGRNGANRCIQLLKEPVPKLFHDSIRSRRELKVQCKDCKDDEHGCKLEARA